MRIINIQPNILFKSDNKKNGTKHINTEDKHLQYPTPEQLKAYLACGKISSGESIMDKKREEYTNLRDEFSKKLAPQRIKTELDAWNFYTNSTDENLKTFMESEDKMHDLYKNQELYKKFSDITKQGLDDEHLDKQVKKLVRGFDEELNAGELLKNLREKENEIAAKYNSYVPKIDDKEVTKAEINKILQTEKNPEIRQKGYEAKVKGGDLIANDVVELVKMRNEFAKTQGYDNYFDYQLKEEYDVDAAYLNNLLDDVYENAKDTNKKLQNETRQELAAEFNIDPDDLKTYHYGLLLDNDPAKDVNKSLATKEQVVEISKSAYKNMGYDLDNLPITLDLFPRKNKNTHGFCFDVEPGKDSRILANLTNNTDSIDTLCHELGHCVYNLGISTDLPYLEQAPTPAMTEAIAMMMGDLAQKENILKGTVPDDTLDKFKADHKKSEARFVNHSMQIINFEREMYKNPNQDLGQLWHDLKCKYKGRSEKETKDNEWATIPHYLSHPAYYQNYFRAALIKAQMYNHLTKELGPLTENNNTANYLNDNLFKYGTSVEENDLIKQFTGEQLSSKALCESLK